jgi:hypothetical protein
MGSATVVVVVVAKSFENGPEGPVGVLHISLSTSPSSHPSQIKTRVAILERPSLLPHSNHTAPQNLHPCQPSNFDQAQRPPTLQSRSKMAWNDTTERRLLLCVLDAPRNWAFVAQQMGSGFTAEAVR